MKTSPTTPRTSRKTSSTAAKSAPAEKKMTAPRVRRAAPKKVATPAAVAAPSADEVRMRAYEIYLRRNTQGDALSDWLQAERELFEQAG